MHNLKISIDIHNMTASCECGAVYTCNTAERLVFKTSVEVVGCPHQPRKLDKLSANMTGIEKMAEVKREKTRKMLEQIHKLYSAHGVVPSREVRNLEIEREIGVLIGTDKYTSIWYWKNKYIKSLKKNEFNV